MENIGNLFGIIFGFVFLGFILYGIYGLFKRFYKFLTRDPKDSIYNTPLKPFEFSKTASVIVKPKLPYKKKVKFFSSSEEAFFLELKRRLPANLYIFPKVRMVDFIGSSEFDRFKRKLGDRKLMPKHIDFLIVDRNYRPIMAIEINGKSHNSIKQKEIDQFKKDLCESIGLPLEVIRVGESFFSSVNRIIPTLNSQK